MKYCIFFLITILLTIVIYNLYNTKIIEEYHEGSKVTLLQGDINNTLSNMNIAFNEYNDYTNSIDTDASKYGSRLSDIDDLYRGSGGILQRINNYDPNTILNTYDEHLGKSCPFETTENCGGSNTLPIKFNHENGRITVQDCARECSERDDCISFSYKEGNGEIDEQECILSSVCTGSNATPNSDDNLYTKKRDDYIQFPLLKYNPNYNKICKNNVYQNIETNLNDGIMSLGSCATQCESSTECIAFEYNPATQLCSPKNECYEDGCLEESSNDVTDNCNNTTLYSMKETYMGGKNSPSYYSCNDCDNNKTIYNEAFLRFYTNDTDTASLIYTNHVANIGTDTLIEMTHYKITQGYQVQVFANNNFEGEEVDYDETGNNEYIWLESNGRQSITSIGESFLDFKSFKIYSNNEANTRKICKGSFGICQTTDSGAYNSNNRLNHRSNLPNMEQIFTNIGTAAECPYENRVCECDGYWGSCTATDSGDIFTQEWTNNPGVEQDSIGDCNIQPRECQCNYNYTECGGNGTYQKTLTLNGSSSDATCPDTNGTVDCNCSTDDMDNYGSCDDNNERHWIGDSDCPNDIKIAPSVSGCNKDPILYNDKISLQITYENENLWLTLGYQLNGNPWLIASPDYLEDSKFYLTPNPRETWRGDNPDEKGGRLHSLKNVAFRDDGRYRAMILSHKDSHKKEYKSGNWYGKNLLYRKNPDARFGNGGGDESGWDISTDKLLKIFKLPSDQAPANSLGHIIKDEDFIRIRSEEGKPYSYLRYTDSKWFDFNGTSSAATPIKIFKGWMEVNV